MKYYGRRKRYAKKRSTVRKSYKQRRPKVGIRKLVRSEISRMSENKIQDIEVTGAVVDRVIAGGDVRNLIPLVGQGVSQATRVGNRIRVKKLILKLHMSAFNQSGGIGPIYFDVYIFKFRPQNFGGGPPDDADMTLFLQDGASSTQYNGNNVLSGLRNVNNDYFQYCYKARYPLFAPFNATTQIALTSNYPQGRTLSLNLTKFVKKLLIFDDAATSVQNDNLYIAIGGTEMGQGSIETNLGHYSYFVHMEYEDC